MPPEIPSTGCAAVRAEIAKYSGWDVNIAYAIAQAENRSCDPTRHNFTAGETHKRRDGSTICVGSYGVMQVGCLHYRAGENRDDLATNIRVAYRVWQGSGYTAWTMFNNGGYREFTK